MLTFEKAIEEVESEGESISAEKIADYLRGHAPELAALVAKDITAGDVHVPSALGNDKKRKGPKLSTAYLKCPICGESDCKEHASDKRWTLTPLLKQDEQHIFYGWASVSAEDGALLIDKQGDVIHPEDLQKAAEEFVLYSRSQGEMHERKGVGRLVASLVTTDDLKAAFGMTLAKNRVGWIVGFKVDDDDVWKQIKSGALPELSIGGRAERIAL